MKNNENKSNMRINDALFLKLSGRFIKNNKNYIFFSHNDEEQYEISEPYYIPDPFIDSTFEYLFTHNNTKLLENMLNSLLFPDSPQLSDIQIIENDVDKDDEINNKGAFTSYLVCKAVLNDNKIIILSIELQLGLYGDLTKRLFKHNMALSYKNEFKTVWSLGIFINLSKNHAYSSNTKLNKIQDGEKKDIDFLNIIEIDLKDEINKIKNGNDVYINEKKIGNEGKEWLKLLGLREWCSTHLDKYIIPKNFKLSNNELFNEAIIKLSNIPKEIFMESIDTEKDIINYIKELEDARLEGKKEGKIITLIISAFNLFKENYEKKNIFTILGKEKFNKSDVLINLEQFEGMNDIKEKFIFFLKKMNFYQINYDNFIYEHFNVLKQINLEEFEKI